MKSRLSPAQKYDSGTTRKRVALSICNSAVVSFCQSEKWASQRCLGMNVKKLG